MRERERESIALKTKKQTKQTINLINAGSFKMKLKSN
jgi:hypothetical protein